MTDESYQQFLNQPLVERFPRGQIEALLVTILQHAQWTTAISSERADEIRNEIMVAFPRSDESVNNTPDPTSFHVVDTILEQWAKPLLQSRRNR